LILQVVHSFFFEFEKKFIFAACILELLVQCESFRGKVATIAIGNLKQDVCNCFIS
jgi:hypothetical protein